MTSNLRQGNTHTHTHDGARRTGKIQIKNEPHRHTQRKHTNTNTYDAIMFRWVHIYLVVQSAYECTAYSIYIIYIFV